MSEDTGATADIVDDEAPAETAEDKASRQGWRPQEEFKGDPDKWVPAEEFLRRGEELMPFLKANSARLEKAQEQSRKEIAELKRTIREFGEYHSKTEQRAYERAMKDLADKQAAAVEANDLATVQETTKEIAELTREVATKPAPKAAKQDEEPGFAEALEAWEDKHASWLGKDDAMTAAAVRFSDKLAAEGVSKIDALPKIERMMKEAFPHKFRNANRDAPAAVAGDTRAARTNGKSWSDLPADAKAQGDRFIKQGLIKSREDYAKDYFA